MTIPTIHRTPAVLIALVLVAAGVLLARGVGTGGEEPAVAAAAELAALETRVADLEQQAERASDAGTELAEQVASLGQRLERQVADLRASMRDLRGAVRGARAGARSAVERAEDASARAERALARAEELARDLTVLEDRFNVHMRRNHGGG